MAKETFPLLFDPTKDHAACGIGVTVNLDGKPTHSIVSESLQKLSSLEYRSGYNDITEESDGAGIRLYGLPTKFFQRFTSAHLEDNNFAVGQYFMPTDADQQSQAKSLIEEQLRLQGLTIAGWRHMDENTNPNALSKQAMAKKPVLWQAIIVPAPDYAGTLDLEQRSLKAASQIMTHKGNLELDVVSQSSESIVYKGMVPSSRIGDFFLDLQDNDFTARAVQMHSRFATNTSPKWKNAQPCAFFIAHNGEYNSQQSNALEMIATRKEGDMAPNPQLSDSIQFDTDVANYINRGWSMEEVLTMFLPIVLPNGSSPEMKAMMTYFALERSSYNGPAFINCGHRGEFFAKIDPSALRPSRYVVTENQFHAYSDDDFPEAQLPYASRIKSGTIGAGEMIMVTRDGQLLENGAVLERVHERALARLRAETGRVDLTFATYIREQVTHLRDVHASPAGAVETESDLTLLQRLESSFWDYESVEDVLRPMAETGEDPVGAMGDDTSQIPALGEIHGVPLHVSHMFHQLFAQVSSPPLDSIKERSRFSLTVPLGRAGLDSPRIMLSSPILKQGELAVIERNVLLPCAVLDMTFPYKSQTIQEAIRELVKNAEKIAGQGGVIVVSDRGLSKNRAAIPDVIAVAAIRKHLEAKGLSKNVSIIADSQQIISSHQAALLLAVGANAVYPSGAYEKISALYEGIPEAAENYHHALEKSLLKIMGKMGITDVNNYINGQFMQPIGLDVEIGKEFPLDTIPNLGNIFGGTAPLGGFELGHIAASATQRHEIAITNTERTMLPRFGHFKPEYEGIKHGFSHEAVNAFTEWLNEEHIRVDQWECHQALKQKKEIHDFIPEERFTAAQGFIDPAGKNNQGMYPQETINAFRVSPHFTKFSQRVENYNQQYPTAIHHLFDIDAPEQALEEGKEVQPLNSILSRFFSGSMSQGSLTVAKLDNIEDIKAHETITRGANAVGVNSSAGEGGENWEQLGQRDKTSRSKQVASGRFGVSARQLANAEEIEIKVAQGAKPGEGGQLAGLKISVRIASQRGSIPGASLISPPPHHDIYSIEDLEQLIHDIKSVTSAKVGVKLVSSKGIGTIAAGVAKAGADIINIAGNSGGTGAATLGSIKHAGMPAELGLAEVDQALRLSGHRERVQLKSSGGLKTGLDVIRMAILGADLFEFGTVSMLTVGCKMQRTCNKSCEPGVAVGAEKFQGEMQDTERYFLNVAAEVQDWLQRHGFQSLDEIRGCTELLEPKSPYAEQFHFSAMLNRPETSKLSGADIARMQEVDAHKRKRSDDEVVAHITSVMDGGIKDVTVEKAEPLTASDRSFGGRIAGHFHDILEKDKARHITVKTNGSAGQSYGFVNPEGVTLDHTGPANDGVGKSMTGGEIIICSPNPEQAHDSVIAGNAVAYGASGGKIYLNGRAGHRCGILMKGAEMVVEGAGQYAFEYMTSGTAMILGKTGKDVGVGSSGGVIFAYDEPDAVPGKTPKDRLASRMSEDLVELTGEDAHPYQAAIQAMLTAHHDKTGSLKAKEILDGKARGAFRVFIPKAIAISREPSAPLARIETLAGIADVIEAYHYRHAPISIGMKVWLEQATSQVLDFAADSATPKDLLHLREVLQKTAQRADAPLSDEARIRFLARISHLEKQHQNGQPLGRKIGDMEDLYSDRVKKKSKTRPILARVKTVAGRTDSTRKEFQEALDIFAALTAVKESFADAVEGGEDCSGCRSQSCETTEHATVAKEHQSQGCPEHKPINSINGLLKQIGPVGESITVRQWELMRQAFALQVEKTPFIAFTGAACPAPCESACTEGISGKPVPIKDNEFALFRLGQVMGWFEDPSTEAYQQKQADVKQALGFKDHSFAMFSRKMAQHTNPFTPRPLRENGKHLVVIGSGPAAMEVAYKALRDGIRVEMYEKSDKPGGLLMDGIPAHKYDKGIVSWHFEQLKHMGLELHLNSTIDFNQQKQAFFVQETGKTIATRHNPDAVVVFAVGAGEPRTLAESSSVKVNVPPQEQRLVQAVDFLKAANDIAAEIKKKALNQDNPDHRPAIDGIIHHHFGDMDPRKKRIVVVGGGDTAQDANRWLIRYFSSFHESYSTASLDILVRGPQKQATRGHRDGYPFASEALTDENRLLEEEIDAHKNVHVHYLTSPVAVVGDDTDQPLRVQIKHEQFKYADELRELGMEERYNALPRDKKPTVIDSSRGNNGYTDIEADIVIQALGFKGVQEKGSPMATTLIGKAADYPDSYVVGDASITNRIIVEAQSNAADTYDNKIRPDLLGAESGMKRLQYSRHYDEMAYAGRVQ